MGDYNPTFRKDEKIVDGTLVETFYIDDHEVAQHTYYSLLEDLYSVDKNVLNKPTPPPIPKIEDNLPPQELEARKQIEEFGAIVLNTLLSVNGYEEQLEYLLEELEFQYKSGYYLGQTDLLEVYADSTKKSKRIVRDAYEDLVAAYKDDSK